MRLTRQRAAILTVLQQTDTHPTADWIHSQVRKDMPHVSLGTVYRNLEILCREGHVHALEFGARQRRYDGNPGLHAHVLCTACGRIADVAQPIQKELTEEVAQSSGYRLSGHRLEWYGRCPQCAASES